MLTFLGLQHTPLAVSMLAYSMTDVDAAILAAIAAVAAVIAAAIVAAVGNFSRRKSRTVQLV